MHGKAAARILLAALAPLALDGCVSVGIRREAAREGPARVEVAVYENASARDAGRPVAHPVFTHLFRVEGERTLSVARSLAPTWRVDELPPGRYRLEATKEIDEEGNIRDLPSAGARSFALAAGETAHLTVLRRKVPVVLVVLAAVTVVALAILAIELDRHGKLPEPPPLPPLPIPIDVAVAFDWSLASRGARGPAPAVADVFPARGSVVAARRVAVTFLLLAPLAGEPDPAAVTALGSRSGEIPGVVSYLPAEQLLRFAPQRDFAPGETVTVTLDLGRLRTPSGAAGDGLFSTSFTVPR